MSVVKTFHRNISLGLLKKGKNHQERRTGNKNNNRNGGGGKNGGKNKNGQNGGDKNGGLLTSRSTARLPGPATRSHGCAHA